MILARVDRPETGFVPQTPRSLPADRRGFLDHIRDIALKCRVAPKTDPLQACALISTATKADQDAYAQALVRCFRQSTNHAPLFYRPGTTEVSFDEAWLVQTVMAARRGDADSLAFLVRSRVARQYQRQISFLVRGIAASNAPS